jgi:hypothetical protein
MMRAAMPRSSQKHQAQHIESGFNTKGGGARVLASGPGRAESWLVAFGRGSRGEKRAGWHSREARSRAHAWEKIPPWAVARGRLLGMSAPHHNSAYHTGPTEQTAKPRAHARVSNYFTLHIPRGSTPGAFPQRKERQHGPSRAAGEPGL